jgi:putative ABC transport system permease protein
MPEVSAVSGLIQGIVQTGEMPYFFVYGYPEGSFLTDRVQVIQGSDLAAEPSAHKGGTPLLLGVSSAKTLNKNVGDSLKLGEQLFRIVGIYQTGEPLEDRGAIVPLESAQDLLGMQRKVSLFYIQLKDPELAERLRARLERRWENLSVSSTDDFASKQTMVSVLHAYVIGIGGLAILIGGVVMMNTQLMAVMERTREIGLLRSVGWSRWKVMWMILRESLLLSFLGGALGVLFGWLILQAIGNASSLFSGIPEQLTMDQIWRVFLIVFPLGLLGGAYPAWRAAQLEPIEALRYEGGTMSRGVRRLPLGGLAVQSLWQRSGRTMLTLITIGLTVGGMLSLEGLIRGAGASLNEIATGTEAEIMVRQEDAASSSQSVIDERIGDRIAQIPGVQHVSGIIMSAVTLPEGGLFMLQGYAPHEFAIRRFPILEGETLVGNRQMVLGRVMAEALGRRVGETLEVGGSRFRIVGIFETGVAWEEIGGIVTLRDAQSFLGKPRHVTMYAVKLEDPSGAEALVQTINQQFPEVHASLSGEFAEQTPDMKLSNALLGGISLLAIFIGGVGVLNTMFMTVFERTWEIGVLRSFGWQRRRVLGMILREALLLGVLGGLFGIAIGFGISTLAQLAPGIGQALTPLWSLDLFLRALLVALLLGLAGGIFPAFRATRLEPIEAIRYE